MPKVEDVINKALEKDRNLRYQHASEMRTDLQRLKRDTDSGHSALSTVAEDIEANTSFRVARPSSGKRKIEASASQDHVSELSTTRSSRRSPLGCNNPRS
jgi:eukaryotic-like serine/threonine-protein kinase